MGKVIAISNQKGGVGKTSTTINLAAALAHNKKRVLLIDLDQQGNATSGLGISKELVVMTSYDLLATDINISEVIYESLDSDFAIIPSSIKLGDLYRPLANTSNRNLILRDKLKQIKSEYDYILLDCPPSIGIIVENALIASDSVIIPVECEYFALEALTPMINNISRIQKIKNKFKESLTIEGVLLTKFDNRALFSFDMKERIINMFPKRTFNTIIRHSVHIEKAPMYGKSVLKYAYNSRGSKDYKSLAKEIIENNKGGKE